MPYSPQLCPYLFQGEPYSEGAVVDSLKICARVALAKVNRSSNHRATGFNKNDSVNYPASRLPYSESQYATDKASAKSQAVLQSLVVCFQFQKVVVRPRRFELLTYSFGGCRSIQLSYGRAPLA